MRTEWFRLSGTDLTQIDGLEVMTATTILSEAGSDMSKWADENHFVSWLRLCPDNRISGDKVIGKGRFIPLLLLQPALAYFRRRDLWWLSYL